MAAIGRMRLDSLLVDRGLAATRSVARALIMAGEVLVEGRVIDKAGTQVAADAQIALAARPRFVSRGGDKLAHALEVFALDVRGTQALDIGASTGGFVDCLLQEGAARVIALDVGRGQLDMRLREDPRVFVLEKVNARYLEAGQLPFVPPLLTMDVSFISVTKVLPAVVPCLASRWTGIILVKPQFEAGRRQVGKGGIVRDVAVHRQVLLEIGAFLVNELGVAVRGLTDSGLPGTDGNVEYFYLLGDAGEKGYGLDTLESVVDAVTKRALGESRVDES